MTQSLSDDEVGLIAAEIGKITPGAVRLLLERLVHAQIPWVLELGGIPVREHLLALIDGYGIRADVAVDAARFVRSALHGFVSLEIAGNFASMNIDPDPVFEIQLATLTA